MSISNYYNNGDIVYILFIFYYIDELILKNDLYSKFSIEHLD